MVRCGRTLDAHQELDKRSRVRSEDVAADGNGWVSLFSSEPADGIRINSPMRPAHSIAFTLNFLYSGPFAFCMTFSRSGMIEE